MAILSPVLLREAPGKFTFMAIPACILGVYLIAKPEVQTDHHGAKLHLAGIVVGLFQVPIQPTVFLISQLYLWV